MDNRKLWKSMWNIAKMNCMTFFFGGRPRGESSGSELYLHHYCPWLTCNWISAVSEHLQKSMQWEIHGAWWSACLCAFEKLLLRTVCFLVPHFPAVFKQSYCSFSISQRDQGLVLQPLPHTWHEEMIILGEWQPVALIYRLWVNYSEPADAEAAVLPPHFHLLTQ